MTQQQQQKRLIRRTMRDSTFTRPTRATQGPLLIVVLLFASLLTSTMAQEHTHDRVAALSNEATHESGRTLSLSTLRDHVPVVQVPGATPQRNGTQDDNTPAPVPVVPVPTLPPSNRTNHTTPAPTVAPSTPAPTHQNHTVHPTPAPTPAPTKKYTPSPTDAPTNAPTSNNDEKGLSFFAMLGKMVAWCIVMGLGVLLYGFCINHKYQIAYYLRHCGHCLKATNAWLIHKIRPEASHQLHPAYSAMYASERNDAQSLLFDAPHGGHLFENNPTVTPPEEGFVMGQHSGMNFQPMG